MNLFNLRNLWFIKKQMLYPLLFEDNLHELVWGGTKLKPLKGRPADGQPIGESWEISDIKESPSVVKNGPLAGRTLGSLVQEYGAQLVGQRVFERHGIEFPLLVKFIDAAHDLSIQVHPNDALSRARHGKLGKTEMWYVMHADPGASLLAGLRETLTPDDYERRVEDGTIVEALARHEVHDGDVFFIPAGRIHAICGGIMVCEIQQSSDVTYRLFDYHRLGLDGKPRELHTELAKDAIDFRVLPDYRTRYTMPQHGLVTVADCDYFPVNVLKADSCGALQRRLMDEGSFITLSCLTGTALVTASGETVNLPTGFSCLIPADCADFSIQAVGNQPVQLLEAWAK